MKLVNLFVKSLVLAALLIISSCDTSSSDSVESPNPVWHSLFDGQSIDQWEVRNGKAPYIIKDGVLVGTAVLGSPNTFLCTKVPYNNFILELDFKCDSPLNSGIQIRSNSIPEYNDGAVHGYQVEIDPSDRAWSGGIYEEGRRGWLYPLVDNTKGRAAYKKDEWNNYRIEAIGEDIRVWLNGIPTTNLKDNETSAGFIGLQVHSIGQDTSMLGKQVRWKDIKIMTKDLEKHRMLITETATEINLTEHISDIEIMKGYTQIDTTTIQLDSSQAYYTLTQTASNFDLKFQFKMQKGSIGGVSFGPIDSNFIYQIIDNELLEPDDKHMSLASLAGMVSSKNLSVLGRHKDYRGHGRWNTGRIAASDNELKFWMNEQLMVDTLINGLSDNVLLLYLDDGEIAFRGLRVR